MPQSMPDDVRVGLQQETNTWHRTATTSNPVSGAGLFLKRVSNCLYRLAENRTDQVARIAHVTSQQHRALDAVDASRPPKSVADDE